MIAFTDEDLYNPVWSNLLPFTPLPYVLSAYQCYYQWTWRKEILKHYCDFVVLNFKTLAKKCIPCVSSIFSYRPKKILWLFTNNYKKAVTIKELTETKSNVIWLTEVISGLLIFARLLLSFPVWLALWNHLAINSK